MIKFVRRFREQLLTENKFTKYLVYASGEIILVVIGILIALQINNWNERKKNEATEHLYYCRMLNDFELDIQLIDTLMGKASQRIEVSKEILIELNKGSEDKHHIINKFLSAIRGDMYVPRNVTYTDLVTSGNLKLLTDINLKNSLIQCFSELENRQLQIKQNRDQRTKDVFELINSSPEFGGVQEFDYVKQIIGQEIIETLPSLDWTKDKNSIYFKKFQLVLLFNIAMADRERQHFNAIKQMMDLPYQQLIKKCDAHL